MESYINKKKNELKGLYKFLNAIQYDITHTETPTDGFEEMELDDLLFRREDIQERITNLKTFLHVVNQTNQYKKELYDTGIKLLYHPSRVSRLLDQNLISLNNSWDNL